MQLNAAAPLAKLFDCNHATLHADACATLVNLTLYPGARSAVLKTNAVETAAKALMGTQAQQSAALALLQNLSLSRAAHERVISSGFLQQLPEITHPSQPPSTRLRALATVEHLASVGENMGALLHMRAINLAIRELAIKPGDTDCQKRALGILLNMSYAAPSEDFLTANETLDAIAPHTDAKAPHHLIAQVRHVTRMQPRRCPLTTPYSPLPAPPHRADAAQESRARPRPAAAHRVARAALDLRRRAAAPRAAGAAGRPPRRRCRADGQPEVDGAAPSGARAPAGDGAMDPAAAAAAAAAGERQILPARLTRLPRLPASHSPPLISLRRSSRRRRRRRRRQSSASSRRRRARATRPRSRARGTGARSSRQRP